MKMAYTATNRNTGETYAICSADPDPDVLVHCVAEIKKWKRDDAIIELLPIDIAKERLWLTIQKKEDKQLDLF